MTHDTVSFEVGLAPLVPDHGAITLAPCTALRIQNRSKGHPPKQPPTVFSKDTVRELLQHEFYSGVVAYYGVDEQGHKRKRKNPVEVFPGEHPALVSKADR